MSPAESDPPTRTPRRLWPARSRATVAFYPSEEVETKRIARRLFGRLLRAWEYAGLAGAPDDARVQLGASGEQLYIDFSDPIAGRYCGHHYVRRDGAELVLRTGGFHIHLRSMRRRGLGLCVFHRQLENVKPLGVKRIETTAGRSSDENGYYTWPRFGFNGPLPTRIRRNLPPGLEDARTVLDLMAREKGRLWWKEHGVAIRVVFQVTEGSRSRTVFEQYVGNRLKLPRAHGAKPQPEGGQKVVLKIGSHML